MTKSDSKCPTCKDALHNRPRVLSYLYQRKYGMKTISKNGNEYDKHSYLKRAYYCEYCKTVFVRKDQKVKILEEN